MPESGVPKYPSMKASKLLGILKTDLGYEIKKQTGSHRKMQSPQHPDVLFSYHDGASVAPGVVRKILEKDVGLTATEAQQLLGLRS